MNTVYSERHAVEFGYWMGKLGSQGRLPVEESESESLATCLELDVAMSPCHLPSDAVSLMELSGLFGIQGC